MDNEIDILIEEELWASIDLEEISHKVMAHISVALDIATAPYEVSILACNDTRIAVLNTEFRGKKKPTNVLSWPSYDLNPEIAGEIPSLPPKPDFGDPFVNLGDIAIAYETCINEAKAAEISLYNHVTHLLTHGILHLLGYDHETDKDAELMENLEIKLLADMGIGNPYKTV
ncbi:rRNA maturation RNase YbeY [Amylibacter sp. SFDW26]|uniref:rRNA maturation RNase YbeY n=1 Tax=Amylibacter sp. SFDW26 TaxID=2652722 RepID=UPI00126220D8|nr:rRNA maturation RNase YbeY [Amylibacter sp. SFDW26]KAB7613353.1 rRNA maturation RNase YbeY [Amylibacter sp. SFDW26]